MSRHICEQDGCGLDAEYKCNSDGKVYCLKHITYFT